MIGFLADDLLSTGGIQHATIDLLQNLYSKANLNITVVARKSSPLSVPVILFRKKRTFIYTIYALRHLLSAKYRTLIISDSAFTIVALILRIFKPHQSLILWEHLDFRNKSNLTRSISRFIAPLVFHKIICITSEQSSYWNQINIFKHASVQTIPNPIHLPEKYMNPSSLLAVNEKHDRLIVVGNNGHVKGVDLLTKAWVMSPRNGWSMCLCGFDRNDPSIDLSSLTVPNSKIELLTLSSDELRSLMERSKYVINFSRTEVFPLTFWEAYLAQTSYISGSIHTPSLAHEVLKRNAGLVLTHYSESNLDMLFSSITLSHTVPYGTCSMALREARLLEATLNNDLVVSLWMNILK